MSSSACWRLGEASRGYERRAGAAADALQRVDRAVEEAHARRAAERGERAERLVAGPQGDAHARARPRRDLGGVVEAVAVDDLDGAYVRARRGLESDALGLFGRDPERDRAPLAALLGQGQCRVDARERCDLGERVLEQFLGVEQG